MLKRMLDRLRSGPAHQDALYDSIVAAARQPKLYAVWGVPDTPAGRIEMVAVHTAVVTQALTALGEAGEERARTVYERFVTDMDDNMREIGVGDLTVPRKVKKAAAAVYDRASAVTLVQQLTAAGEKERAAAALVEIEETDATLDRAMLGRYFARLISELSSMDAIALLGPGAEVPLVADAV